MGGFAMLDTRDQIVLEGLQFICRIGALPFEKEIGQPVIIDIVLYCQPLPACTTDELDQTIHYGEVYAQIRHLVENSQFSLIERLAGAISEQLLAKFTLLDAISVLVRKPHAPVSGLIQSMGIRIYRERSSL
jgi:dihydroneopterin aldolase